jgi:YD repeat-containing protein
VGTATLLDAGSQPIAGFVVQFTVTGANPGTVATTTNAAGVATFTYTGTVPGTDVIQAAAIGGTAQLASPAVSLSWTAAGSGPSGIVSRGWIGAPAQQARVTGLVPITVGPGVTVASSTVSVWPARTPGNVTTLATNAAGGPGATLATFDTTTLPNGSYIIDVTGTDSQGNQQANEVLVAVSGDYKPGRVVVDVPEFTVPVAGLPITIGRHYDSLNRDKVQDFGYGWSLAIGHPDLEVDQAGDVTITLPNGRRSTFIFEIQPAVVGPIVLGFVGRPLFVPEPGVFGTLTGDGCSVLVFNPYVDNIDPICFDTILDPVPQHYTATTYRYTDAYGTVYTMGADGSLRSIQDRNQNILTFTAEGITSSVTGQTVAFTRDGQNRITKIVTPTLGDFFNTHFEYDYGYDPSGNLSTADRAPIDGSLNRYSYTYDGDHRLQGTTDPLGHPARTSTYDGAGRLATDTDALGNVTHYGYDVAAHTTTTTYPDTGVLQQTFDDRGLLLSQTDQVGRTTTHVYDTNRNEVKRTNALGEATTYGYDSNGNQTSSKNALGETTTTTYNAFSEPLTTTNPIGNTTTIVYDDSGLPVSFSDSLGPLASFTSSEHGLPTIVTDAAGNSMFLDYDTAGNLTFRTDRLGRKTGYTYDPLGRQLTKTTPRGAIWQYGYDNRSEQTAIFDPINGPNGNRRLLHDNNGNLVADYFPFFGHSFNYTYDALNHLTQTQFWGGSTVESTYDFRGNKLTDTDEIGHVTSYTYDLAGQLVQTTYADGKFTLQGYDPLGRLSSKTDERGNTTTYGYQPGCDCTERLTSVTDPLNRTTLMTYDGMGRKTSTTDPAGHTTFYGYDLRGHLIETDYADGTATHDTYDDLGRRTASTDQTNATTHYGYDAEGQLTSVSDPLGNLTQYGYERRRKSHLRHRRQQPRDQLRLRPDEREDQPQAAAGHDRDVHIRRGPGAADAHRLPRQDDDVRLRLPQTPPDEDARPNPGRAHHHLQLQPERHALQHGRRERHDHLHLRPARSLADESNPRRDVDVHLRFERQRGEHRFVKRKRHVGRVRLGRRQPARVGDRQSVGRNDNRCVHGDRAARDPRAAERGGGDVRVRCAGPGDLDGLEEGDEPGVRRLGLRVQPARPADVVNGAVGSRGGVRVRRGVAAQKRDDHG